MGLVSTWIAGIGLSYAWPNLEAAGIVTPKALAGLDVTHFAALGVKDADDRRKLFYLVQRIKLAVLHADEHNQAGTTNEDMVTVDQVLALTLKRQEQSPTQENDNSSLAFTGATEEDSSVSQQRMVSNPQEVEPVSTSQTPRVAAPSTRNKPGASSMSPSHSVTSQYSRSSPRPSPSPRTPVRTASSPARTSRSSPRVAPTTPVHRPSPRRTPLQGPPTPTSTKSTTPAPSTSIPSPRTRRHQSPLRATSVPHSRISSPRTVPQSPNTRKNVSSSRSVSSSALQGDQRERDPLREIVDDDFDAMSHDSVSVATEGETRSVASQESVASRTRSARQRQQQSRTSQLTTPRKRVESSSSNQRAPSTTTTATLASRRTRPARLSKPLSTIPADRTATMSPLNSQLNAQNIPQRSKAPAGRSTSFNDDNSVGSKPTLGPRRKSFNNLDSKGNSSKIPASHSNSDSERSVETSGTNTSQSRNALRRRITLDSTANSNPRSSSNISASSSVSSAPGPRQSNSDRRKTTTTVSAPVISHHGSNDEEDNSFQAQIENLRLENSEEYSQENIEVDNVDEDMRIRVVVRKRPMSRSEANAAGDVDVIHPLDYGEYGKLFVYQPRTRVDLTKEVETVKFCFDNVFGETSTNMQIYERTVRSLIPPFFDGQWGSVFAYGQTGSGKTFTMMGSNVTTNQGGSHTSDDGQNLGLYYMAALDIFQALRTPGFEHFSIGVSMFEIYGGKLFDLLSDRKQIKCLEDSQGKVRFPGLSEHAVHGPDHLMALIGQGGCKRSTGSTSRNADSSRSHAVLQLHLRCPPPSKSQNASSSRNRLSRRTGNSDANSRKRIEFSRLSFIDLAGSERGADTSSASRATRMEGAEINTSLLALKEVIRALAADNDDPNSMAHVPFRGSKLTQVLKESFVGVRCRSVMVACVAPNMRNCEPTLNTLRYAHRVKERNPETGLSAVASKQQQRPKSVSPPSSTKANVLFQQNGSFFPAGVKEPEATTPTSAAEGSDQGSTGSYSTRLLDDILDDEENRGRSESGRRGAWKESAEFVINTHKEVLSTQLDMVKEEMQLVNRTQREDWLDHDYITAVNDFHERQLQLFATLRESLAAYRAVRNFDSEDDDDVEDLRD